MNPHPLSPAATPISGAPVEVDPSLEDLLTLPPAGWMATASCQYTDPEVFFPIPGKSLLPARRICHRCPVVAQCLRWALATGEPYGVLGGHSVSERRALSTAMRAWAATAQLPCPPRGPVPPSVQEVYLAANTAVAALAP